MFTYFTEFTETTTVDDHDGISKHRLMPISHAFYNITFMISDVMVVVFPLESILIRFLIKNSMFIRFHFFASIVGKLA